MFSLFPRRLSLVQTGIFRGFTDWHSHILPGVDDGARTLDESLHILRRYEELGIRTAWLTPHIMEDMPNTTAHLRRRFDELRAAYCGPIALHLASENMLDNLFEQRLARQDLLPLGTDGTRLLVETSYFNPPMDLDGILHRIQSAGYHPVLAHPERYVYMTHNDYLRLHTAGIRFQLNLLSLAGLYGPDVQSRAQWLCQHALIHLLGTDTHRPSMLDAAHTPTRWLAKHGLILQDICYPNLHCQ